MRARHSLHSLPAVPVYSAAFLANDLLAVGGGGGVSKSGINNKLARFLNFSTKSLTHSMPQRLYTVNDERSIALLDEFQLQGGEDAPMSMAADTEVRIPPLRLPRSSPTASPKKYSVALTVLLKK